MVPILVENNLARWEAVCDKLAMAAPAPAASTTVAPADEVEKCKAVELSTDELCNELMHRLHHIGNNSENQQAAREHSA